MTISENAKKYIANHFGAGTPKCFVSSGISYTDPIGGAQTGSTKAVVQTLKLNAAGDARGPGGETFYDITDFRTIDDDALRWIGSHQSGTDQYCVSKTQTCVPGTKRCRTSSVIEQCNSDGSGWDDVQTCGTGYTCQNGVCVAVTPPPSTEHSMTPPLQLTIAEGTQCPKGAPKVILDVSDARAYFKVNPLLYVGVMGIDVTNVNQGGDCFGFFVWEMRMWPGKAGDTCPKTEAEVTEISRFLAEKSDYKTISPQLLGKGKTGMIGGSFEIPPGTHGTYTLCLSLWGNHDEQALLDELAAHDYDEKIAWED